jgi:hypothetical protein
LDHATGSSHELRVVSCELLVASIVPQTTMSVKHRKIRPIE